MANDFLPFATEPGANVISQADYDVLTARQNGFLAGIAKSNEVNKVWRQSSFIIAAVAQYVANQTGDDVLDDGDFDNFVNMLTAAVTIGSGIKPALVITTNATYNITTSQYAIGISRAVPLAMDVQLPAAAQVGQVFEIQDLAGNFFAYPVRVLPPAGDTIAGAPNYTLNINRQTGAFRRYTNNLWGVAA